MTITQIKNESSPEVVDIIIPIQQFEFNVPITLADQPDLLDIESTYYLSGGAFWGARVHGTMVGTIALIRYGQDKGAIRKMFVRKEFRGREFGVAKQLLEALIEFSLQNGINHLSLGTVQILKGAHRFYEKNGFNAITAEELQPGFPRMHPDDTFYEINLKAV